MKKQYHVYGIGAALVDTEINVSDVDLAKLDIEKGVTVAIDEKRRIQLLDFFVDRLNSSKRYSGGSTANAITAVTQFGGNTFYTFKVGDDDNGQFYLNDLTKSGIDYDSSICCNQGITGTCLVMITPDAERTLNSFHGINTTLSEQDIVPEAIINSDYVYFAAYMVLSPNTRAAVTRMRKLAVENGIKLAMSLSDPRLVLKFHNEICEMLDKRVDLLFCNRAEALNWAETDNLDIAIDSLKNFAVKFAITLGVEGSLVYDGKHLHTIEAYKVQALDTNGAGDMFAGAFLYAMTQGKDFVTAGKFANFSAAVLTSNYGSHLNKDQQQQILADWNKIESTF